MKKRMHAKKIRTIFALCFTLALLCLAGACGNKATNDGSKGTGEMAGTGTTNTSTEILDQGGANGTDNDSLVDDPDNEYDTPDAGEAIDDVTDGMGDAADGVIDGIGDAAGDVIDGIENGVDDLTGNDQTPESQTNNNEKLRNRSGRSGVGTRMP